MFSKMHQLRAELFVLALKDQEISSKLNVFDTLNMADQNFDSDKIIICCPENYYKTMKVLFLGIIYRSKIYLDFYDLHLIRIKKQKVPIKIIIVELILIILSTGFFTRSGEMNALRNKSWIKLNSKRIIFFPDMNLWTASKTNKVKNNNNFNKLIIFGGTYRKTLRDFILINPNKFFKLVGFPKDYHHAVSDLKNVKIDKAVDINLKSLEKMNLSEYAGFHFLDDVRKLYKYSASIKYLTYTLLDIPFWADRRHRIARFYYYLFPEYINLFSLKEMQSTGLAYSHPSQRTINRAETRRNKLKIYIGKEIVNAFKN
ncbi:hypothetical protein N9X49_01665 [Amylibacter sp.]|nr:hypothetical protein [Amylibacter sp.]